MKRIILPLAILFMLVPILSQAQDSNKNIVSEHDYLFVLSANSGTMDGDTLTLKGVASAVYFSDRPARIAGHKSMKEFAGMWSSSSDGFKADPPNATLSILKDDGATNIVVELLSMQHQGDLCVFKVKVLEGNPPESFGAASLFVDSKIIGIDNGI